MSDDDTTRILNRKAPKLGNEVDETVAYSSMQKSTATDKTASSSSRDEDYTKIFRPTKPTETVLGVPA